MSCLELLVGLNDADYSQMQIHSMNFSDNDGRRLCPLTNVLMEKIILQSAKRTNSFENMTFTPDQSRTLVTSGTRTDIALHRCKFEDDGAAFLEALAARADPQTGLAELTIEYSVPFAEGILVLCVHMLECLILFYIDLETEEACRALAEAEL
jgi:hypothetical protein